MSSILNKIAVRTQPGGRPPAAVEIAPEGVVAAALAGPGQPAAYAFAGLPEGAVTPGVETPNLHSAETVANAIRSALGQVSPRSRAVTLVLPDTLVRVFILDFDSLPGKAAEAIPVLRFRLRKMVPFDVEHAGVSYQVLTESKTECRVLTAVIPGPVLHEYEAAVRAAGYEPGAVLPASLAALEGIHSMEAVLTANLSRLALTTCIANGEDLLLYRILDLPEAGELRQSEIQRGIAVATAYYEDRLGARPQQVRYSGTSTAEAFAGWIADPELAVVELAPKPESGLMTALGTASRAGVAGALAGAR